MLWVFIAWCARSAWATREPETLGTDLLLGWCLLLLVAWSSAFRVRGPELGSEWLQRCLPHDRAGSLIGELAADALLPLQALLAAALMTALGAGWLAGAAVLAVGALVAALATAGSRLLATRAASQRGVALIALAWRGIGVAVIAALMGGVPR